MSVAVVMLTLNGREDTLLSLRSLLESDVPDLRVILVDNGSTDGTSDAVHEEFGDTVRVLPQPTNLGFSEGNNVGIRVGLAEGADWVMIVNNDTLFATDTISQLIAAAESSPDIGVVCPLILYADPPDLIWYAGRDWDPRRGYHGRPTGLKTTDRGQYAGIRETGMATGCAMLMPAAALEKIGLLDAELFFYCEDVDWCLRFREAGYRIVVAGEAKLWHRVSSAFGGENNPTVYYYGVRNTLVVNERHAPLSRLGSMRRIAVTLIAYTVFCRQAKHRRKSLSAVVEGFRDYRASLLGARSTHFVPEEA